MSPLDLIIRDGTLVNETAVRQRDIGIAGGKIVEIREHISSAASEIIDATGLHIFPGVIDAHVHFNEPGRTDWEGIETGSRAVAAGGGTLFVDMPLNAHPPTIDAASFAAKKEAAEKNSVVDFALWGGLVPQNLDSLEELAECGVIGFKAFMCNSGIDDFDGVDDRVLREGMKRVAPLKLPVAVHAESQELTAKLTAEALAGNRTTVRDYLNSRPIEAELDAIHRAIDLAGETGCALHIVHVSSAAGVRLVAAAKKSGLDVSCETCPHYLALTDDDVEQLGAIAKCSPPIRSAAERDALWRELLAENILTVGSDHSPSPPSMKQDANFFKIWGGISGAQHLLPLLLTHGHAVRNTALNALAKITSSNVATRFKLPDKGRIAAGFDADLALVSLTETVTVRAEDLFYRHKQSPYVGAKLRGKIHRTLMRGHTVFHDGRITGGSGRFIRPITF